MVALTKTERRIYRALQERPRSADELRNEAWWDHPNGGPEHEKTIYVHISNLRKRLNRYGLTVECEEGDDGLRDQRTRRKGWVGERCPALYRIKYFPGNSPAWKEFDTDAVYVAG
jgi:hypothetical protein